MNMKLNFAQVRHWGDKILLQHLDSCHCKQILPRLCSEIVVENKAKSTAQRKVYDFVLC